MQCEVVVTMLLLKIRTCQYCGLVDGTTTQAMVTVVENRDLALGDGFVRFVKRNLHSVGGPALAHRNRDRRHAMADLYTRSKALGRERGSRGRVAPYPREIVRNNVRCE
jgi:hypothetical protein